MALTGSIELISKYEHDTLTTTSSVSYPADLESDDPNYEKRGQTVDEIIPLMVITSQSYDSVYVRVNGVTIHTPGAEQDDIYVEERNLTFTYSVFPSAADKAVSGSTYLNEAIILPYDPSIISNPFDAAYSHLKTLDGYGNLIDC